MFGSNLVPIVIGVVAVAVIFAASLPPTGRYYVQSSAIILGMTILIAAHWRRLENRWAWVAGAAVGAALVLYFDYPSE